MALENTPMDITVCRDNKEEEEEEEEDEEEQKICMYMEMGEMEWGLWGWLFEYIC